MPTLLRLLLIFGVIVAGGYGAMIAVVTFVRPQPREIVQIVALPQTADLRTGRSAATALNEQAALLAGGRHRRRR